MAKKVAAASTSTSASTSTKGSSKGDGKGARDSYRSDPGDDVVRQARPIAQFPDLADVLPELCTEYRGIAAKMKALEDRRKELSSLIMPLMEAAECDAIEGDGWVALRVCSDRPSLSKEKLLEAGVSLRTIEACTRHTKVAYVQVREPRRED